MLLFSFFLILQLNTNAQQDIAKARQQSWHTMLFQIPADSAVHYLKKYHINIDSYVNQHPFAIRPADSTYYEKLPVGHYLLITVIENEAPQAVKEHFIIESHFEHNGRRITTLKAGEKAIMKVRITVFKEAHYVLIEIPIPAGCTYASREQKWNGQGISERQNVIFYRTPASRRTGT